MRRLPVYLLLDCSESMAGQAIQELQQGVARLIDELQLNPQALETAYLSIIAFSRTAETLTPLVEISSCQSPSLKVRTGTSFGAALRLLQDSIRKDVITTTAQTKGDYRPLVFIFSDGQPTDEWEGEISALHSMNGRKIANIYAFGCGPDADTVMLEKITDIVFTMKDLTHEGWQKVFVWLSASVCAASVAFSKNAGELVITLPPPPDGVLEKPNPSQKSKNSTPSQLFLHARCSQDGSPYLMRFLREPRSSKYRASAAHPLDELEKDGGVILPPVDSADLLGVPTCPYCRNGTAILCACGTLICYPEVDSQKVTCPACSKSIKPNNSGQNFDLVHIQG